MPGVVLPSFPENVLIQTLPVVDFDLLKNEDFEETEKLWDAATKLGFWYLKNHGAGDEADGMFAMGEETMDLPLEEKLKFSSGVTGGSFGYKAAGLNVTDDKGTPDTAEFLNVAKDDILSYPTITHRSYPDAVQRRMDDVLKPFVDKSLDVTCTVLRVFEKKLGLQEGSLLRRHAIGDPSGSEARCIRNPGKTRPTIISEGKVIEAPDKLALGAHTDFGSLSFLHHNKLGGLQVLAPGTSTWHYVKPIQGHAICNVGDALTIFSGGILRSALHRVLPAPGEQAFFTRWSVVFFLRPGADVMLHALTEESSFVADAIAHLSEEDRKKFTPNQTAGEWHARRVRGRKVASNVNGTNSYRSSAGMEHNPIAFQQGISEIESAA
ncbi:Clavaminate synthase-like protein [Schizopora paradoxa]|uniref:Clavaminate synthase-like protein n=1 Tax=Schizopora paradoxa TaxID=27342 RepID=A0A0H2S419_9AGAM|nr:Clavaminate synthase-like protein [Schizopora paradoxa]